MPALELPPALRPGDLVRVVAPSSPAPRDAVLAGLAWVRGRYRIRTSARIFAREGYLAGGDAERREELQRALDDPEARAILAVRGGYGAMRLLGPTSGEGGGHAAVDLSGLRRRPRWIVGFSDVTALHAEAWRAGVASIHGPHVGALGMDASPRDRAAWIAALERPEAAREWSGLTVVHAGAADGPLVGGNLTLLAAMAAAGRLRVPEGALLALEDTGERPYRVDRMLTALTLGGHLAPVRGVVVGGFDRCAPGPDGVSVLDVIAERTRGLGVPVLAGAPFGHAGDNEAWVVGGLARIVGDRVVLGALRATVR